MRHAEPKELKDYYGLINMGVPRCCHSCEHYDKDGVCVKFNMEPPEDFAKTMGECAEWSIDVPF